MEAISRSTEDSDTISLISHRQQSKWVKNLKIWALGVGSIVVSIATVLPVSIINNWKKTKTFSFTDGIHDFVQNPPLLVVPELTTTLFITGAYKALETLIDDVVNKNFSKTNKLKSIIKNQILSLVLIATNEIVKKINEKLTTSSAINTDIFADLFVTVALNFSKEILIIIIWKGFELWIKAIKAFDFYTIGIPVLSMIGYVLFNCLQTFYNLGNNNLLLENFSKTFFPIISENTVNGIFRIISSSLLYYQISFLFNNNKKNDSMTIPSFSYDSIRAMNDNVGAQESLVDTNCAISEVGGSKASGNECKVDIDNVMPSSEIINEHENIISSIEESKQESNYKVPVQI